MAKKTPKSDVSINVKYSSTTGELVIDGETVGVLENFRGEHPTLAQMQQIVREIQRDLPFSARVVDNLKPQKGEE